jgi:signal peptidase I
MKKDPEKNLGLYGSRRKNPAVLPSERTEISVSVSPSGSPGKAIAVAFIAALLMKFFLFDFMITDGHSMMPAIKPGTVLVVIRTAYGFRPPGSGKYLIRWAKPKAGDVVIFFTPRGDTAVKRCTALVGEDAFFAQGDNSGESYDSRFYGPIPLDHIIGKVLGIR